MPKLLAIINVIAWSGFWAFGYLAVTAEGLTQTQLTTATLIAALGFATGMTAYLKLVRTAETSGYARKSNQLDAAARNRAQTEGGF